MPRGRPKKTQDDALIKSAELIGWAIGGLEREINETRVRLASLTAQAAKLRARAGRPGAGVAAVSTGSTEAAGSSHEAAPATRKRRTRRKMSAEGRKRISEAMTRRWAERRKGK